MFVGAYWSERAESGASAAHRLSTFLGRIRGRDGRLTNWYRKARSRATALRNPLGLDEVSLARELTYRLDMDRKPLRERGFDFFAWDGFDATLSATIGCWSPHVGNAVVVSFSRESLPEVDQRPMLEAAIEAFDPHHAVVSSQSILRRSGASSPWLSGVWLYSRGGIARSASGSE